MTLGSEGKGFVKHPIYLHNYARIDRYGEPGYFTLKNE